MILNDVKEIVNNLEDFVELPRAIERLRKVVIALAVSGKLLDQKSDDGSGEELFNEIQQSRSLLPSRKKRKTTISPVTQAEAPFEIPNTWKWVRMGEVCYIEMGQSPEGKDVTDQNVGLPFFQGKSEFGFTFPTPRKWCLNPRKIAESGDILLSVRAPVGSTNFASEKCGIGRGLAAVRPELEMPNVFWRIVLDHFTYVLLQKATGTTFQAIKGGDLNSLVVPLPPLTEQRRIVEKVGHVMSKIDALEAKKIEREDIRKRLTKNAMHSLGLGDADIALQNLEELVKTPSDLKELEKSILTLAVSGRLISQDRNDGDANDFYTRVNRDNLGRKKKNEVIMPEDINKTPFDIPNTWKWVSLGDICGFEYGFTDSAKDEGDARFVRITDMGNDSRLISENHKFVELNDESKKAMLREGDALVARIGATFGRTILFKEKYPAVYASYLIRITFDKNFLLPDYYWIFAQSNAYWDQALSLVSGSAQPQFNANLIKKILLPVPPHAEQIRIVKKVEEMMELIRPLGLLLSKK